MMRRSHIALVAAMAVAAIAAPANKPDREPEPEVGPEVKRQPQLVDKKVYKPKAKAKHHSKQAGKAGSDPRAPKVRLQSYDPSLKAVQHLGPKRSGKGKGRAGPLRHG